MPMQSQFAKLLEDSDIDKNTMLYKYFETRGVIAMAILALIGHTADEVADKLL